MKNWRKFPVSIEFSINVKSSRKTCRNFLFYDWWQQVCQARIFKLFAAILSSLIAPIWLSIKARPVSNHPFLMANSSIGNVRPNSTIGIFLLLQTYISIFTFIPWQAVFDVHDRTSYHILYYRYILVCIHTIYIYILRFMVTVIWTLLFSAVIALWFPYNFFIDFTLFNLKHHVFNKEVTHRFMCISVPVLRKP